MKGGPCGPAILTGSAAFAALGSFLANGGRRRFARQRSGFAHYIKATVVTAISLSETNLCKHIFNGLTQNSLAEIHID
ncbi:hypothetical protein PF005_g5725 [Phytophthora fragariae]|uniref:Uncharacterized protein n=1 Tax=Phytophthora fragariae TaxID=53985 RepID=A0A6A4BGQ2_9STRA|nr:hypothetical protein PF003_g31537 [Phytophthora fragariae]KAE8944039.1 hypothetical protein PF009_g6254 [Phytophthora fragariae]KAE9022477.1 hypothetical protein PF011_g4427 [Phytophthora fragariae]KAE9068918.1 hypothetical protein PF010_g26870 [Phytophthora fragariae]KAE9073910.1 hypothetical protein PF006_g28638 [Phytophthora fragariae]